MQRRDFVRACALSGLSLALPGSHLRALDHELVPYDGRFLIVLLAGGGWDPSMVADPRGSVNRTFGEGDILTAGNIRYAPIEGAQRFFERHYQRMVVVNGINFATGSHEAGVRYCSSGHLGTGHPTLAAVFAASKRPELPLAYLTFGGYENDEGVVPPIRNLNAFLLEDVANPELQWGREPYHSVSARALIDRARGAALRERAERSGLPRYRQSAENLVRVRAGVRELRRLQDALPTLHEAEHKRQAQIGLAGYRAGIGVALNLAAPGIFDSHGDHDRVHTEALTGLYDYLEFIWNEAERQGVADRIDLVITSDFGRTPHYDSEADGNGKGHWPIGSIIVVSSSLPRPNRVVGATDEGLNAIPIDPATLAPSTVEAGGVELTPEHVHENIRRWLGVDGSIVSRRFPLRPSADVDLF